MARPNYVFMKESPEEIEKIRAIFEKIRKGNYGCNEPALDFHAAFGAMPLEKFAACFELYQNYLRAFQIDVYKQLVHDREDFDIKNEIDSAMRGNEEEIISQFIRVFDDRDPETLVEYLIKDNNIGNLCYELFKKRFPNVSKSVYNELMQMVSDMNGSKYAREKVIKETGLILNRIIGTIIVYDIHD